MIATGWALRPLRRLITLLAAGNRAGPTTRPVPGHLQPRDGRWKALLRPASFPVAPRFLRTARPEAGTAPETIVCAVCNGPLEDRQTARVWMDPHSVAIAGDFNCLARIGEPELGLEAP